MKEIKTIVLTTDLSDSSRQAFESATTIAVKFGAKIIVAYVEDDHYLSMVSNHAAVSLDVEQVWEAQHELSRMRLAEIAEASIPGDVELTCEVCRGTPHGEIVRLAKERGADLIVMATHGRGSLSAAIMGSTTGRVIRSAPCPVLAVRSPVDL